MPLNLPLMSANSYFGMAVEAIYGTAASIGTYTPVDSPKVSPAPVWLDDSDFRGSPVMHYDQVAGVAKATFDAKTFTYTDVYPNLLRAALGSTDTVTGGGPYVHTIGLLNSASTGSQAPSYTIINNSVDETYQAVASRLNTLSVSFSADAAVENTFQFVTNLPASIAPISVSTLTESTQHLIPAWNCAASIGGASVSVVESMELDIKRNTNQIFTLGSQSATSNFQGPIEVTGKFVFVVNAGEQYWNQALVRNQQAMVLNLVDPFTNYSILYQMSAVQLENPVIDTGKAYVTLDCDFIAIANTTDAVTAGYSPIKTVVTNGISQAY